jgi:hypothetical protein
MFDCLGRPLVGGLIVAAAVFAYQQYHMTGELDFKSMSFWGMGDDHDCIWKSPGMIALMAGVLTMAILSSMSQRGQSAEAQLRASLANITDFDLLDTRT